jgi:hypothetical protein
MPGRLVFVRAEPDVQNAVDQQQAWPLQLPLGIEVESAS